MYTKTCKVCGYKVTCCHNDCPRCGGALKYDDVIAAEERKRSDPQKREAPPSHKLRVCILCGLRVQFQTAVKCPRCNGILKEVRDS